MARIETRQDDERDLMMLDKFLNGMTYTRIATFAGISRDRVGYRIKSIIEHDIKHDQKQAEQYWRPQ